MSVEKDFSFYVVAEIFVIRKALAVLVVVEIFVKRKALLIASSC